MVGVHDQQRERVLQYVSTHVDKKLDEYDWKKKIKEILRETRSTRDDRVNENDPSRKDITASVGSKPKDAAATKAEAGGWGDVFVRNKSMFVPLLITFFSVIVASPPTYLFSANKCFVVQDGTR